MKLYEFTLEVHDGENEYILHQFVAASGDRLAARFVQQTALQFRPHARYDAKTNLFQARGTNEVWRVGSTREVTEIVAPCADGGIARFTLQAPLSFGPSLSVLHSST